MKVLVVDDEPLARRRLAGMLRREAVVTTVLEAATGTAALQVVHEDPPDLVLLDIRMPGMDGLEVARQLEGIVPVVFTTAYDSHALDAFRVAARDYLLKPIGRAELAGALARLVAQRTPPPVRLTVHAHDGTRLVDPSAVTRIHAREKYAVFSLDGREHLLDQSLSTLETQLPSFVRVHRSELVRVDGIVRLHRDDEGWYVDLSDGQVARVSRRHLGDLRRRLGA